MAAHTQDVKAEHAKYALVGVVEHRGSQLASGHYAAFVQRGLTAPGSTLAERHQPQAELSSYRQVDADMQTEAAAGSTAMSPKSSWDDIALGSPCPNTPSQGSLLSERPAAAVSGNDAAAAASIGTDVEASQVPAQQTAAEQESRSGQTASDYAEAGSSSTSEVQQAIDHEPQSTDANLQSSLESDARRWYYVSDAKVSRASKEAVLACEAYILLYMHVS